MEDLKSVGYDDVVDPKILEGGTVIQRNEEGNSEYFDQEKNIF